MKDINSNIHCEIEESSNDVIWSIIMFGYVWLIRYSLWYTHTPFGRFVSFKDAIVNRTWGNAPCSVRDISLRLNNCFWAGEREFIYEVNVFSIKEEYVVDTYLNCKKYTSKNYWDYK
jgi:hypothetical protein